MSLLPPILASISSSPLSSGIIPASLHIMTDTEVLKQVKDEPRFRGSEYGKWVLAPDTDKDPNSVELWKVPFSLPETK